MPITPDEFIRANDFDAAFAQASREREDVPAYDAAHLSLDDVASATELGLPLSSWQWDNNAYVVGISERKRDIVTMFHTAIREKNSELVMGMVRRGVVSPDVPDRSGSTPLATAINEGNLLITKLLLDLGADVNLPCQGRSDQIERWRRQKYGDTPPELERTPLMLASAGGKLALVKLLMDAGADDGHIAPDGAMGLRLAADAGHRDVVDFLPLRRGGAFRRWKVHNGAAMHRLQRAAAALYYFAKFFVWEVPKFFLRFVPKHTLKVLGKLAKWAWKQVRPCGGFIQRAIKDLPRKLKRAAQWVWRGLRLLPGALKDGAVAATRWLRAAAGRTWELVKAVPPALAVLAAKLAIATKRGAMWTRDASIRAAKYTGKAAKSTAEWTYRQAKETPRRIQALAIWTWEAACTTVDMTKRFVVTTGKLFLGLGKAMAKWVWKMILAIPDAIKLVWEWLKKSTTAIGKAVVALLATPLALLHTAALAVISLLQRARNVTLKDLWAALVALGRAIVDLPKQVCKAMAALGDVAYGVMEKLFGFVGVVVYAIGYVMLKIVLFIPKHVLEMVKAAGSSLRKGGHEVAAWINPKW